MAKTKFDKECILCGEHYKYCQNCGEYVGEPVWKNLFHDENCKNVFEVLSAYGTRKLPKVEAKKILSKFAIPSRIVNKATEKQIEEILSATETEENVENVEENSKEVETPSVDKEQNKTTTDNINQKLPRANDILNMKNAKVYKSSTIVESTAKEKKNVNK